VKQFYKRFDIIGGVASVYTGEIDLEESPRDNSSWLQSNAQIYGKLNRYSYDENYVEQELKFLYKEGDEESMMEALRHSLGMTKKHLLPELNKVQTLRDCVEYYRRFDFRRLRIYADEKFGKRYNGYFYCEGLLNVMLYSTEEYSRDKNKAREESEKWDDYYRTHIMKTTITEEKKEAERAEMKQWVNEQIAVFKQLSEDPEWRARVDKELEQRKEMNQKILEGYGVKVR
jgi:hypothetical protein